MRTLSGVKILHVVGARPNFMKVAPILAQLREREGVRQVLVHTGQHYDAKMSEVFFRDLGMPAPDVHLGVGSGTHAQQTAKVMVEVEPVLLREKRDVVLGQKEDQALELVSGLNAGETIAVTNTFSLKAELSKPKDED